MALSFNVRPNSMPRLFALIIGISDYENLPLIPGAIHDALAVKTYIQDFLNVPTDRITTLFRKEASKFAIIRTLNSLCLDARISKGDPILIYYAGHSCVSGCLAAQDYCEDSETGQEFGLISSNIMEQLLTEISISKGDNITVILDCCYSALITGENIPSSHILLAACRSYETAWEYDNCGKFTTALLKLLRTVPPDSLRYSDILAQMDKIRGQKPQCRGLNKTRYMFNSE